MSSSSSTTSTLPRLIPFSYLIETPPSHPGAQSMERGVARIAILEPAVEVRLLFARHVPSGARGRAPRGARSRRRRPCDRRGLGRRSRPNVGRAAGAPRAARHLREHHPAGAGSRKLSPHTYLVKPFALDTLGLAIAGALKVGRRARPTGRARRFGRARASARCRSRRPAATRPRGRRSGGRSRGRRRTASPAATVTACQASPRHS